MKKENKKRKRKKAKEKRGKERYPPEMASLRVSKNTALKEFIRTIH
jgi:hypothetical protein